LWWAGKELLRAKKLEDYIGKNEKTKIVAKLQKVLLLTSNVVLYFSYSSRGE
jgi:hypothetical protein